jgi:hypothetical protein
LPLAVASGYPGRIDEIEEFLFELEQQGEVEVFDDGEEFGDVYVFFVADDEATEFGLGRRIDLPMP